MSAEFFDTTIGEQVTLQRGFDITKKDQVDGDVPVVSSGGISSFHNKAMVAGPGVVLGRKGSLGTVFYIPEDFWPHDTSLWVKDFKGNNPRFVYYYFKNLSEVLKKMDVGAANPALNRNHVHPLPAKWTNRETQDSIVTILASLDDKIELNHQINQTLEQIAQTIFKSWFVDFEPVIAKIEAKAAGRDPERAAMCAISGKLEPEIDQLPTEQYQQLAATSALFPDELVESEFGLIPEGWEYYRADEIAEVGIGKTPPRKEPEWFSESAEDMRWVSIRDMGAAGAYLQTTAEFLKHEAISRFNVRVVPDNTVLLSFKLTVGRVSITDGEMVTNEAIAHLKAYDTSITSTSYIYFYLKNFDFSRLGSTSSIADAVNSRSIREMFVLVPNLNVVVDFSRRVEPLLAMVKTHQRQIQSLAELRDSLLPRLLNGTPENLADIVEGSANGLS